MKHGIEWVKTNDFGDDSSRTIASAIEKLNTEDKKVMDITNFKTNRDFILLWDKI
jgi:hypothetical protein